jgi:hypothetical protein
MPIAFAGYLTEMRARKSERTHPCLISSDKPDLPTDFVRLPHLVAYTPGNDTVSDRPMWELLNESEAVAWLGGTLPDQNYIECNLPRLLALRAAYRARKLPGTPLHEELAKRLDGGRYLSILFVYQNFGLIRSILEDNAPA